jgi:uncharacterized protein (TIGR02444 family)
MTAAKSGFRRFALAVYHTEGVSHASLLLQARCDIDVTCCCSRPTWAPLAAARSAAVTSPRRTAGYPRQTDVVGPLRALRKRLKDGPPPAPSPTTAALRDRVKALELDAEMLELDELATFADDLNSPAAQGSGSERTSAAMDVVLHVGAGREPSGEERGAIAVIANAAARYGDQT